jgi:hypothetical protein
MCPLRDLISLKFFSQLPPVHIKLEQVHNLLPCSYAAKRNLKLEDFRFLEAASSPLGWYFWNSFSSVADAKCYVAVVDAHATMR